MTKLSIVVLPMSWSECSPEHSSIKCVLGLKIHYERKQLQNADIVIVTSRTPFIVKCPCGISLYTFLAVIQVTSNVVVLSCCTCSNLIVVSDFFVVKVCQTHLACWYGVASFRNVMLAS